jgi:hypothetical protein
MASELRLLSVWLSLHSADAPLADLAGMVRFVPLLPRHGRRESVGESG